ncbi:MAG: thiamine-binding protein [Ruminococcaceae bacterium]|nr:thiamine-binding protein [Oscillospiraceae bacterium]
MSNQPACNRPDLPWAGRGTNLDISGCRFSLYPMHSDFVRIILGALEKTDTSNVWSQSDALSTVYRGKLPYVNDAVYGLFANAYEDGVHIVLEGLFSKGCPGDSDGDSFLAATGTPPNRAKVNGDFPVQAKIELYPLGDGEYIDSIAEAVQEATRQGLNPQSIHYATRISGTATKIFDYLQYVCQTMQDAATHYVLHFTLSVNSPTAE